MVGDITGQIDPSLDHHLDRAPSFRSSPRSASANEGETYNINADVVAGKIAEVLKGRKLVLLTNTPGVLRTRPAVDHRHHPKQIDDMVADGTLAGGMLPKISSAPMRRTSGMDATGVHHRWPGRTCAPARNPDHHGVGTHDQVVGAP